MAANISANLNALYIEFQTLIQQTLLLQNPMWPRLASRVPSKTLQVTMTWLDRVPGLRQWIASRSIQNVAARSYNILNLPFELTLELDRFQVEDNQIGLFSQTVPMMAKNVALLPDQLLFFGANATGSLTALNGTIPNGSSASSVTYDGVPYFSAAHPVNQDNAALGTQTNYYSSGQAFSAATYTTIRQNMVGLLGADGFPLLVQPDLLVVPPQLEIAGRQVLNAEIIATSLGTNAAQAQTNVLKGSADLLAPAYLQGAAAIWYLFDTHMPIKPLVFTDRQAAEWVFRVNPEDQVVFDRHMFQYGVNLRCNTAPGPWFLATKASA